VHACLSSGENPRVNDEPLLTEPEAAEVLRVSTSTLKRWRLAGTGPPVAGYVGRSPRYRRSELLAWIRRGKPTAGA
jgi:predicted DNA-binding transcriptional regulator AlpA